MKIRIPSDAILEIFKALMDYDPETGVVRSFIPISTERRYLTVWVGGKSWRIHRVVWYLHYGYWPTSDAIDHINGNPRDNRISNLRAATNKENARNCKLPRNSSTGAKGVTRQQGKFRVRIKVNMRKLHLGYYNTLEEAKAAYAAASRKYHGEFGRVE